MKTHAPHLVWLCWLSSITWVWVVTPSALDKYKYFLCLICIDSLSGSPCSIWVAVRSMFRSLRSRRECLKWSLPTATLSWVARTSTMRYSTTSLLSSSETWVQLHQARSCFLKSMNQRIHDIALFSARNWHHKGLDGSSATARSFWEGEDRTVILSPDRHQPPIPDHGRQRPQTHEPQTDTVTFIHYVP